MDRNLPTMTSDTARSNEDPVREGALMRLASDLLFPLASFGR